MSMPGMSRSLCGPPERTNRTSQTLVCTGFEVLPQHQLGSFRHQVYHVADPYVNADHVIAVEHLNTVRYWSIMLMGRDAGHSWCRQGVRCSG